MPMIFVRAVEGRVARESAKGRLIASDKFVPVNDTPYIRRLIEVHGDIEVRKDPEPKPVAEKKPEKAATPAK